MHQTFITCIYNTCILLCDKSREFPSFVQANWYSAFIMSSITTTVHNNSTASSPESPVNSVGDMLAVTVGTIEEHKLHITTNTFNLVLGTNFVSLS